MKSNPKLKPLLLLLLTTLCLTGASHAASFKLECVVVGYPGFVQVKPELRSILGGRVRWNASLRCYETDRVQRGEKLRITISPSTAGERCNNSACVGVSSSNGQAFFGAVTLPYVESRFSVSTNPSFDNVWLKAWTTSGYFERRLPIGRRP